MKVIFMGTPEFSCVALQKLIADPEMEVIAVYTREPQIAGRGHKITNSPIHNLALKNNLKIFTPKTLKDPQIQQEFTDLKADIAVVVAYGLILPQAILDGTKFGCVNIHPSLLPKWRGAAPIHRPLMNGDEETGITIIKMNAGLDSGDIIIQEKLAIDQEISYFELEKKLSEMGAEILLKALKKIAKNDFTLTAQDHKKSTYAKKIDKEESKIDWNFSAAKINNLIRALNGHLGAYFIYKNERIKILKAKIIDKKPLGQKPGEFIVDQNELIISCKDGFIKALILQREGKKPMTAEEFLKGFHFENGGENGGR